ncbi:hypothetical protein [Thermasporomyces composti]|uniref:hypothetical protein n=1 Tax=Thermasporomyces composti TaxID=696763 RepID=UPI0011C040C7|nr:hypothetical protein [Thermasporomyces composti]
MPESLTFGISSEVSRLAAGSGREGGVVAGDSEGVLGLGDSDGDVDGVLGVGPGVVASGLVPMGVVGDGLVSSGDPGLVGCGAGTATPEARVELERSDVRSESVGDRSDDSVVPPGLVTAVRSAEEDWR